MSNSPPENLPLITIITVVYNGEIFLERAIQSVIRQSYPRLEYIVIDGGSTDGTLQIIKKHETYISKWISEKDRGISHAFNKGIELANGKIIGILNADDWYQLDALEKVAALFHKEKAEVVSGAMRYWKNGEVDYIFFPKHIMLKKEMTVNHPATFVLADLYSQHGLYREDFKVAMDYEIMLRFKVGLCRFIDTDDLLANMSLDGVSDKLWMNAKKEVLYAKNLLLGYRINNYTYYLFSILKTLVRQMLEKSVLYPLVEAYRKRYSVVKKIRN